MTNAAIRFACLFVMTIGPVELQREAPKPAEAAAGAGVIRGRVVASDTQAPIRDATVTLRPADVLMTQAVRVTGPTGEVSGVVSGNKDINARAAAGFVRSVRVDSKGDFELGGVPAGRYRLAIDPGVTAARYLPTRFPDPASDNPAPLTVASGQVLDKIVIPLPRAAAISGRVVDEHGSPMALVAIQAQEVLPGDRRRTAMGFATNLGVRSDDMGSFRVFGLRPGEYVLTAQPARTGAMIMEASVVVANAPPVPPSYFPGTLSPSDATRIRVVAGEEVGPIEFTVAPVRPLTVRGVLLDPAGQPVGSISVNLRRSGQPSAWPLHMSHTTRPDGTFELTGVPPGDYTVSVNRFSMDMGSQYAWMPIAIQDDIEGLTVRLQSAVTVTGHVLFEGPAPSPLPTMYVRSAPGGSNAAGASSVMPAEDRSFTLDNQFGPMLVRADGPPGWHLKSVLYGGRDVIDQPTEFVAGGGSLQVVLTQRAATLSGIVSTSANVPCDATVVVFAEDPALWNERASLTRGVMTSATGQYRLDGLRAGRYLAVAVMLEDASTISGPGPAYFELLARHATPVMLGDGESKTLDLKRVRLQ